MGWDRRSRKAWETRASLGGAGGKSAAGTATLGPQAWPPTVLGAGQGGQHFPSQPGVSSPGVDTPVVWTGSLGDPNHVVFSGKSLALGVPSACSSWAYTKQRTSLSPAPVSTHIPFLWPCLRSPPLCTPPPQTRSGRDHFPTTRLEASGTQERCQGPTGAVPSPTDCFPPESPGVWEVPRAKPGEMRHHQYTNSPASWAGSYLCDSPWAGQAPPYSALPSTRDGHGLGSLPRDRSGNVPGQHAGVKDQDCSPDHPPNSPRVQRPSVHVCAVWTRASSYDNQGDLLGLALTAGLWQRRGIDHDSHQ